MGVLFLQETVSDVSDCVHSMKKLPIVLIMDDPCQYITHQFTHYPVEAEEAYGSLRRGCFETVSEYVKPKGDLDKPALTHIEDQTEPANTGRMLDPSPLVHPDSSSSERYMMFDI